VASARAGNTKTVINDNSASASVRLWIVMFSASLWSPMP
jgi:hypothetical protein